MEEWNISFPGPQREHSSNSAQGLGGGGGEFPGWMLRRGIQGPGGFWVLTEGRIYLAPFPQSTRPIKTEEQRGAGRSRRHT